jgi:UDP-galactopyranose mutase
LASKEEDVIFLGRLAEYKYYDMDDVIRRALDTFKNIIAE